MRPCQRMRPVSSAARMEALDIWRSASGRGALDSLSARWQTSHSFWKMRAPSGGGVCLREQARSGARATASTTQRTYVFENTVVWGLRVNKKVLRRIGWIGAGGSRKESAKKSKDSSSSQPSRDPNHVTILMLETEPRNRTEVQENPESGRKVSGEGWVVLSSQLSVGGGRQKHWFHTCQSQARRLVEMPSHVRFRCRRTRGPSTAFG